MNVVSSEICVEMGYARHAQFNSGCAPCSCLAHVGNHKMSTDHPLKRNLAPCKHGAKGWSTDWTWSSSCPTTNRREVYIYIYIERERDTSGSETELGLTKTSRSGKWCGNGNPLARQELLTTATATLSRDFCYQQQKSCSTLQIVTSCLRKWLCMTLHCKRKWKQNFKTYVLRDVEAQGVCVHQVSWFSSKP